jgi:WD40 repeat protein
VKAIEFAASDDAVLIGVQISGESENSQARLLRISDGRKVATLDGRRDDEIQGVAMDCGGENFAVAANAASTVIGRRSSGRRQPLRTPGRESRYRRAEIDVTRLAYSPDGRILVTGSRSGIVSAWDSDSSTLFSRLEADPETLSKITALDFDKLPANECGGALRESYRLGVGYNDGTVRIFRIKTSDRAGVRYAHPKEVYSVAFGPEGLLATASDDGAARVFSATASDLALICQYRTGQRTAPQSIAFSQDGRRLAIGAKFGDIYMLNAEQCASGGALGLEKAWTADSGANVSGLAFSPISPLLATGSQGGLVQLWAGPEYRGAWKAKLNKRVTSVTFDRSGARLAVGSCDSKATVWRLAGADGERADMVASYLHTQPVTSVAFSVGGELFLTGSLDGDARLWDLSQPAGEAQPVLLKGRPCQAEQSAKESIDCPGGPCPVRSVAFSPTRPQLATASQDGSAWLWEISKTSPTSAFPIFVYRGHAKPVNALAFNREGDRLATASQDGSAAVLGVWPLSAEDTLAYAEISRETRIAPRGGPSVQYRAAPQTPDGPPCPSEPEDVLAVDSAACASTIYPALENDERSCRADASHCERALRSYAITTCYFEKIGKTDEARRTRHRRASLARLLPMERSAQVWRDLASRFRAVGCGD